MTRIKTSQGRIGFRVFTCALLLTFRINATHSLTFALASASWYLNAFFCKFAGLSQKKAAVSSV